MKTISLYLITVLMMFILCFMGLKACDYEAQQNETKNRQWVEDSNNGKPYTNYGAE